MQLECHRRYFASPQVGQHPSVNSAEMAEQNKPRLLALLTTAEHILRQLWSSSSTTSTPSDAKEATMVNAQTRVHFDQKDNAVNGTGSIFFFLFALSFSCVVTAFVDLPGINSIPLDLLASLLRLSFHCHQPSLLQLLWTIVQHRTFDLPLIALPASAAVASATSPASQPVSARGTPSLAPAAAAAAGVAVSSIASAVEEKVNAATKSLLSDGWLSVPARRTLALTSVLFPSADEVKLFADDLRQFHHPNADAEEKKAKVDEDHKASYSSSAAVVAASASRPGSATASTDAASALSKVEPSNLKHHQLQEAWHSLYPALPAGCDEAAVQLVEACLQHVTSTLSQVYICEWHVITCFSTLLNLKSCQSIPVQFDCVGCLSSTIAELCCWYATGVCAEPVGGGHAVGVAVRFGDATAHAALASACSGSKEIFSND